MQKFEELMSLVDFSLIRDNKIPAHFQQTEQETVEDLKLRFGTDAENILRLCMCHWLMTKDKKNGCYVSPMLRVWKNKKMRESCNDAKKRLREENPEECAKEEAAGLLWDAQQKLFEAKISAIAKAYNLKIVFDSKHSDDFDIQAKDVDGNWSCVGRITCI